MNTTGPPLSDGSPTHLADYRFHLPDAAVHETGQRWARCRCATWTYALGLAAAGTLAASAAYGCPRGRIASRAGVPHDLLSSTRSLARARSATRGGRRPVDAKANGWAASDSRLRKPAGAWLRDGGGGGGAARIIIVEFVALSV